MKKILFLIFIAGSINVFAQSELPFNFDFAQFKYDSLSNYLEVYYSFNQQDLETEKKDGKNFVDAIIHIQIQNNKSGELVVNKNWAYKKEIDKNDSTNTNNVLLGVVGYVLKEGDYSLSVSLNDKGDLHKHKDYNENLVITPFDSNEFSISNIELSNRIVNENANKNSIFYKNTLEVYPNPTMIYSELAPVMFYYSELYNLNKFDKGATFTLTKLVQNSEGRIVKSKSKKIKSRENSIVEIGFVNLSKLPTGTYTFILNLKNDLTDKAYASSKKFFLINPKVKKSNKIASGEKKFLGSEFGVLTMEECNRMFDESKLLASKKEIDQFKQLDSLNQKRKFLFDFWTKRDMEPATAKNEFKELYFKRIKYCNEHFKGFTLKGYKTDRGRVYTLYGKPSEIERHPSSSDFKPYEIWRYNNIEGGATFIFGDITGFNNYELLHSTKRGELQDPNWQRRISM